jgi:predicted DNA-binding transcriptional regulator AlpA
MSALIDTGQIAEILGVTRQHVTDKLTKRPDFPRPELDRSRRLRKWKESDVRAWMRGQDARPRPRPSPGSTQTTAG